MTNLKNKVALITGGSSGLGAAAARQFAREGAKVMIAARRKHKGETVVQSIEAMGGEAAFIQTDVARTDDVKAMVEATVSRFGRLDCAVNNAGIGGPIATPVADISEEAWDEVIGINLRAVWLCMKYQLPVMLAQGKGTIVNISSIYGYKPSDVGHAAYSTSKFGLIGLSKTAAVDYGRTGVRINVVAPGFTRSEMIDPEVEETAALFSALATKYSASGRLGEPEETAHAITWLSSDAAKFVNGVVLSVDGGSTSRLY